jgi:hypothetical protein
MTVLVSQSRRPTYAIILLVLSVLFLGATFLPFLDSVLFPSEDLERVISALGDRGSPPLDADTVIQEAKDSAGLLRKVLPVAYYSGRTTRFQLTGGQEPESTKESQGTYVAWFQNYPKPILIAITLHESNAGRKTFSISRADPVALVRGYMIPIVIFAVSLFLARKRKSAFSDSPPSARRNASTERSQLDRG